MREHGTIYVGEQGSDKVTSLPTLQCVHCGGHWQCRPGSGNVRGYCWRCNGPVCGPACAECVPVEQRLEQMEAGDGDE